MPSAQWPSWLAMAMALVSGMAGAGPMGIPQPGPKVLGMLGMLGIEPNTPGACQMGGALEQSPKSRHHFSVEAFTMWGGFLK